MVHLCVYHHTDMHHCAFASGGGRREGLHSGTCTEKLDTGLLTHIPLDEEQVENSEHVSRATAVLRHGPATRTDGTAKAK